jgi:hypothetical protein
VQLQLQTTEDRHPVLILVAQMEQTTQAAAVEQACMLTRPETPNGAAAVEAAQVQPAILGVTEAVQYLALALVAAALA